MNQLWPAKRSRKKIELRTDISECGTFRMISVAGKLTIDTASELLDELRKSLHHTDKLKVNLSGVEYLDSSGISVLIQGLKLAQEHDVEYVLLDMSPKVKAVIELSQLDSFFTTESSTSTDLCAEPA